MTNNCLNQARVLSSQQRYAESNEICDLILRADDRDVAVLHLKALNLASSGELSFAGNLLHVSIQFRNISRNVWKLSGKYTSNNYLRFPAIPAQIPGWHTVRPVSVAELRCLWVVEAAIAAELSIMIGDEASAYIGTAYYEEDP